MAGRRPHARRRRRRAAACIAAAVLGGSASAQSVDEPTPPIGFPAGPFVIAPSLKAGYSYDTNVLLQSATAVPPPSTEQVLTLEPTLLLTVPFSNSMFQFGDTLTYVDYKDTAQPEGKTSNDAVAELALNFSSLDKLDLNAHHIAGVADTLAFDPGGEQVFQGHAFRFHDISATMSREVFGARGYRVSLAHHALSYERQSEVSFFNYRGFEGEGSYLEPLSSNARIAVGYLGTRYDHFDNGPGADPTAVFRTESGNTVYGQLEGHLGPKQPYTVRLGWERLAFEGNAAKDFSGLIGKVDVGVIVGGGTELNVHAQRQPYRSFFEDSNPATEDNNFYVYDDVGLKVNRRFPRGSSFGGQVDFSRNSYAEPATPAPGSESIYREDREFRLEGYANLAVRDRIVFRLTLVKQRKDSNYPGADYDDTVVFGGFVFG